MRKRFSYLVSFIFFDFITSNDTIGRRKKRQEKEEIKEYKSRTSQ